MNPTDGQSTCCLELGERSGPKSDLPGRGGHAQIRNKVPRIQQSFLPVWKPFRSVVDYRQLLVRLIASWWLKALPFGLEGMSHDLKAKKQLCPKTDDNNGSSSIGPTMTANTPSSAGCRGVRWGMRPKRNGRRRGTRAQHGHDHHDDTPESVPLFPDDFFSFCRSLYALQSRYPGTETEIYMAFHGIFLARLYGIRDLSRCPAIDIKSRFFINQFPRTQKVPFPRRRSMNIPFPHKRVPRKYLFPFGHHIIQHRHGCSLCPTTGPTYLKVDFDRGGRALRGGYPFPSTHPSNVPTW